MILSIFGPDGVGKSTISNALQKEGWFTFSGTGVASWPDTTWHERLKAQGIEDTTYDSEEHFLEKIKRAHEMAHQLEKQYGNVQIDSDPFHKTLMHDFLKNRNRFDMLYELAYRGNENHCHLMLYLDGDIDHVAATLQSRIQNRGRIEHFDPKSIDESRLMVKANEWIKNALISRGDRVISIEASRTVDVQSILLEL